MTGLSTGASDARSVENGNKVIGTQYGSSDQTTIWSPTNVGGSIFVTDSTEGYAINILGERVGRVDSGTTGYYSDGTSNSTFTDLGFFLPTDINDTGQVSGSLNGVATLYNAGFNSYLTIGKLNPTDSLSDALSINSLNQVVGISDGTGGFSWTQPDGLINLNTRLAPGYQSWSILSADGVNDNGWITGQARFNGQDYAVVLAPVPEPSSLALASFGVAAGAFWARSVLISRARVPLRDIKPVSTQTQIPGTAALATLPTPLLPRCSA